MQISEIQGSQQVSIRGYGQTEAIKNIPFNFQKKCGDSAMPFVTDKSKSINGASVSKQFDLLN